MTLVTTIITLIYCLLDVAKHHFVAQKAEKMECNEVQRDDLDSMVDSGAIHLYEQQDEIERCDEFLPSLDTPSLDDLSGYYYHYKYYQQHV